MNTLKIKGPTILQGEINISGSKNSALPILFVSLLTKKIIKIKNIPQLRDIKIAKKLLIQLGVKIKYNHATYFDASNLKTHHASCKLVKKIRASIWMLAPLVVRLGKAKISYPGGCNIGKRPIDLHIFGLKKLGVQITLEKNYIKAYSKSKLQGTIINMPKISVGATITVISAAVLAIGITIIKNAACEPEINDIANYLNRLGAKIFGAGTQTIYIQGVPYLNNPGQYSIPSDRIETGTFLIAAAISKGNITCLNTNPKLQKTLLKKLYLAGALIRFGTNWINLNMTGKRPKSINICTGPYPKFPTDLQPQITLLNSISKGKSYIIESIFENRFMHIPELIKMGANIISKKNTIICQGVHKLVANQVVGTDLRATATLILAGCIAEGTTIVKNVKHVIRGYENIEKKLNHLGAKITIIKK